MTQIRERHLTPNRLIYRSRSDNWPYEFKENEIRANQLYRGKRITATGTVGSVENYSGRTVLVFERGLLNPDTVCYFKDVDELAQLRRNQGVTVEATVRGFDGEKVTLRLDDCSLR